MKASEIEYREMQDECVDMLVRAAFKWQEIKNGQCILAESEKELNLEEIERSKRIFERFAKEKEEHESRIRKKARKEATRKVSFRAVAVMACIALLLSVATPLAVAYIEPLRTCVLGILIDIGDRYATVSMQKIPIPANWQGSYYMNYLPDGFELKFSDANYMHVEYADEMGHVIKFTESLSSKKMYIDNENVAVKRVSLDGKEISVIEGEGECTLVWNNGDRFFFLTSNISQLEMLKVAQSVRKIGR